MLSFFSPRSKNEAHKNKYLGRGQANERNAEVAGEFRVFHAQVVQTILMLVHVVRTRPNNLPGFLVVCMNSLHAFFVFTVFLAHIMSEFAHVYASK